MVKKKVSKVKKVSDDVEKGIKTLTIGAIIFLAVSLLAIFVTPNFTGNAITGNAIDIFLLSGDADDVDTQILVTKYIIFLTMTFILYWALDLLITSDDKTKNKYGLMKFLIAAGIGWISMAFLVRGDLLTAISGFSALGILFTVGLPFLAVLLINSRLVALDSINAIKLLVQRIIWGAYSAFLVYYLFTTTNMFSFGGYIMQADPNKGTGSLAWVILIVLILSALAFIFNDRWVKMLARATQKADVYKRLSKKLKHANEDQDKIMEAMAVSTNAMAKRISSAERVDERWKNWAITGNADGLS